MNRRAKEYSKERFKELSRISVEVITQAFVSLEHGGTVREAKAQLNEIGRKLAEIEWEYKGGCNW